MIDDDVDLGVTTPLLCWCLGVSLKKTKICQTRLPEDYQQNMINKDCELIEYICSSHVIYIC